MKSLSLLALTTAILLLLPSDGVASDADKSPPTFRVASNSKTEQMIRHKLANIPRYQIIFEDNTIFEAIQYLADASDLPVYFDKQEGFRHHLYAARMSIEMEHATIQDALNVVCEKAAADFVIEGNLLMIVPKSFAANRFETVVYDLRALEAVDYPIDSLPTLIQKTVAPLTWDRTGVQRSPDSVNFISKKPPTNNRSPMPNPMASKKGTIALVPHGMLVCQSQPVQREIEKLLQTLWKLANRVAENDGVYVPKTDNMFLPSPTTLPFPEPATAESKQES